MEDYLPVYLWTIHHKKFSNNLFWELMSLLPTGLTKTETAVVDEVQVPDNVEAETTPTAVKVSREKLPCLYCGGEYGGLGGLKRHLHFCRLNPNKKVKLAPPVEVAPLNNKTDESFESDVDEYPCLYCEVIFSSEDLLSVHLTICNKKSILSK